MHAAIACLWALAATPALEVAAPSAQHLELSASLRGRLRASSDASEERAELSRARFGVEAALAAWLSVEAELELAAGPELVDAYATLRASPALELAAGRMKRPFGAVATRPSSELWTWNRGLLCHEVGEEAGFGGRGVGARAQGDLAALHYAVGIFGARDAKHGDAALRDGAARLSYRLAKGLRLGASLAVQRPSDGRSLGTAGGVDATLRRGRVRAIAELVTARAPGSATRMLGGVVSGDVRLAELDAVALHGMARLELFDASTLWRGDHASAAAAGLNLHFGEQVRLFLQGEVVSAAPNSRVETERRFVTQLAFDGVLEVEP